MLCGSVKQFHFVSPTEGLEHRGHRTGLGYRRSRWLVDGEQSVDTILRPPGILVNAGYWVRPHIKYSGLTPQESGCYRTENGVLLPVCPIGQFQRQLCGGRDRSLYVKATWFLSPQGKAALPSSPAAAPGVLGARERVSLLRPFRSPAWALHTGQGSALQPVPVLAEAKPSPPKTK